MKILLATVAAALIAAFLYADRKWRQWMAARQRDRENESDNESRNKSDGNR